MTRFMITLEEGVELVWHAFTDMIGKYMLRKYSPMSIIDIAKSINLKMVLELLVFVLAKNFMNK